MEYPSSKPSTPNSESEELETVHCPGFWPPYTWLSGTYLSPLFWSCSTAWRWEKVPRSTSCRAAPRTRGGEEVREGGVRKG